jgi:hypothetical protein
MKTIIIFILYIGAFILWIFDILIPFGGKILIHIQNNINLGTDLDLLYCGKQLLIGIGYTVLLSICSWLVASFIIFFKK